MVFWLEQQEFPDMLIVTIVLDHVKCSRTADGWWHDLCRLQQSV